MGQSSGEIIALASVFTFLAIVAAALREWVRVKTKQGLGADDVLSYAALVTMIGLFTVPLIIICLQDGFGKHIETTAEGETIPPSHRYMAIMLVLEACGYIPIALAKCSVLLFYRRSFYAPLLAAAVWTLMGLIIAWLIAFFFGTLFQCTPIETSLTVPAGDSKIHCIDRVKLFSAGASIDIMLGVAVLLVPLPSVLKLQMPTKQRIGVLGVFLTGALAIAASIARLVESVDVGRHLHAGDADTSYFMAPTMYWTMIEAAVCIIAVCLPIFCGVSSVDILNSLRGALPLQSHSRQSSTCREPSFDERNRKDSKASECSTMFDQPYQGLSRFETTAEKGPSLRDRDDVPERGIVVETTISRIV